MDDFLSSLRPQLQGMQEMYRAGYTVGLQDGRRQAWLEIKLELDKILKERYNVNSEPDKNCA